MQTKHQVFYLLASRSLDLRLICCVKLLTRWQNDAFNRKARNLCMNIIYIHSWLKPFIIILRLPLLFFSKIPQIIDINGLHISDNNVNGNVKREFNSADIMRKQQLQTVSVTWQKIPFERAKKWRANRISIVLTLDDGVIIQLILDGLVQSGIRWLEIFILTIFFMHRIWFLILPHPGLRAAFFSH